MVKLRAIISNIKENKLETNSQPENHEVYEAENNEPGQIKGRRKKWRKTEKLRYLFNCYYNMWLRQFRVKPAEPLVFFKIMEH